MTDANNPGSKAVEIVNPKSVNPETVYRKAFQTALSKGTTQEAIRGALQSIEKIALSDDKIIEIIKDVVKGEITLSEKQKEAAQQYLELLAKIYHNEASERRKDLLLEEIMRFKKEVEQKQQELDQERREFFAKETEKIQNYKSDNNSNILWAILGIVIVIFGGPSAANLIKKYRS